MAGFPMIENATLMDMPEVRVLSVKDFWRGDSP